MAREKAAGIDGKDQSERRVITKKRFAEEIKGVVAQELGIEIGTEAAWDLFKGIFKKTVDLAVEKPVSLAGIGIFEVERTRPRGSKVGVVPFVPRFRLRASSAVSEYLEHRLRILVPEEKQTKAFSVRQVL
jgi:hypothetical protein